ncbi:TetR/AcrR family transcriptional regulator [Paraglaciecola aquimarina]|uniref:TetR/AcrR family transcriptional regulator n=1 Tax=Paraglaciecola aquimarina TaxID=1235557 RepID=A0ABU3SYT1_9ALTE|nr:TetR/AcrR family transcriptional regulator [Paraglaciecola aquimarina]MDU0355146.1 TetR/AcrR family transcriptional regulator [Paraglaciecola aquimarina]
MKSKEQNIAKLNRQKILSAAEKEFALHGFKGARVQKIADRVGLPKTNVLYYFKTKEILYLALLEDILSLWNGDFDNATSDDDPALVLAKYIADKMEISRTRPEASKIFALEIINNAPNLSQFFRVQHKEWMQGRVAVIQQWIDKGKLPPTDPFALLFHIWATTQHYSDFSAQITELRGQVMYKADYKVATKNLVTFILTGCGLSVPPEYKI